MSEYPITGRVWFRDSTQEWVLELSGSINDTYFNSRHTAPPTLAPEDVPGLDHLYARLPPSPVSEAEATARQCLLMHGFLTPQDACQGLGLASSMSGLREVERLRKGRCVLGVWVEDEGMYRYPAFQFADPGYRHLQQRMQEAVEGCEHVEWDVARWWHTAHPLLGEMPACAPVERAQEAVEGFLRSMTSSF